MFITTKHPLENITKNISSDVLSILAVPGLSFAKQCEDSFFEAANKKKERRMGKVVGISLHNRISQVLKGQQIKSDYRAGRGEERVLTIHMLRMVKEFVMFE